MVQALAALLSWIALLAVIAIAFLMAGIWRPHARRARAGLGRRARTGGLGALPSGNPRRR